MKRALVCDTSFKIHGTYSWKSLPYPRVVNRFDPFFCTVVKKKKMVVKEKE